MQERAESTRAGRVVISAFAIATLVGAIVWNLPDSHTRRQALRVYEPYMQTLGLDQNWSVFAPDPRREVVDVEATVHFADGTLESWTFPRGNALIGEYWDYRWRKWLEYVISDQHSHLWEPAALYAARKTRREGTVPVRVSLTRRFYALLPPGPGPDRTGRRRATYYTLELTPRLRKREGLE